MTPRRVRLVILDVDGTLLEGQSYAAVFRESWERPWRRFRVASLLAGNLTAYGLRRLSPSLRLRSQERWARGMGWLLAGAAAAEVAGLLEGACRRMRLRSGLLAEARRLQGKGLRLVLASTAVIPVLAVLGPGVGADAWAGTPLELVGGRYTGRLAGPVCNGERKLHYLEALARGRRWAIDWEGSWAYSDGRPDLPLLERVGQPVVVDPDPALAAVARSRGWAFHGQGPP